MEGKKSQKGEQFIQGRIQDFVEGGDPKTAGGKFY